MQARVKAFQWLRSGLSRAGINAITLFLCVKIPRGFLGDLQLRPATAAVSHDAVDQHQAENGRADHPDPDGQSGSSFNRQPLRSDLIGKQQQRE
jgi:hypothetical protein